MEGEIPFNPSIRLGRFLCALAPSALRDVEGCFVPTRSRPRHVGSWRPRPPIFSLNNDNARTGQDLDETILNPSNVNSTDFGKEFTDAVGRDLRSAPLHGESHDPRARISQLVFVATENDSVYAFDADNPDPALWHDSLINPAEGITSVPTTQGDRQE